MLKAIVTLGQGVTTGLPEASATRDPIELFGEWFDEAKKCGLLLPESASLATATKGGVPSSRMVLLKEFSTNGFIFYTNYGSRKAREMDENPSASLLVHWAVLQRQVRVEGTVERIGFKESDAYFHTRSRGSKIGAWASRQSEVLAEPPILQDRFTETQDRFNKQEIPLPPFWGGYRLVPKRIEFWQGRSNRLHDRLVFTRAGAEWSAGRLYP